MKTRTVTVIAQDPSVKASEKILRSQLVIPWESLQSGPKGSRFHVIDHDFSTDTTYEPVPDLPEDDPYDNKTDQGLLDDPSFHAVNTYVICMSTLAVINWGYAVTDTALRRFMNPALPMGQFPYPDAGV